jgi:hypothetical protein
MDDSPTMVHTGTAAGVILGTAAYMAPAQARGTVVGRRADIWAFGAVLFEMLTGQRPFPGRTVPDVLAQVLTASRIGPRCRRIRHQPSGVSCGGVCREMNAFGCPTWVRRAAGTGRRPVGGVRRVTCKPALDGRAAGRRCQRTAPTANGLRVRHRRPVAGRRRRLPHVRTETGVARANARDAAATGRPSARLGGTPDIPRRPPRDCRWHPRRWRAHGLEATLGRVDV